MEMGGKSSSAPLLENNDTEKTNGKMPVSAYISVNIRLLVVKIKISRFYLIDHRKTNLEMNLYYFSFRLFMHRLFINIFMDICFMIIFRNISILLFIYYRTSINLALS